MFRFVMQCASALLLCVGVVLGGSAGAEKDPDDDVGQRRDAAHVFVHSKPLGAGDRLTDGEQGKPISISSPTTLVWIDRMPGARYEHPTEYVLISAEGTKVVKGGWWPVLNGKSLFRDGMPTDVSFPQKLTSK